MNSQKISSSDILPDLDIRNIYQAFLIPRLISILKDIMNDAILNKTNHKSHPHYQQAVKLLHSIPLHEFKLFNEPEHYSIAQLFAETGFVEGLEYIKNETSLIEKKFNDNYFTLTAAITNPFSKEPLKWLINHFKSNTKFQLFSGPLQRAVIEQDINTLRQCLPNKKPKLTAPRKNETYSQALNNACWIGNLETVKLLCEKIDLHQFDCVDAVESALQSAHHDIVFYLLNQIMQQKSFCLFMQLLFQMVTKEKFKSPGNYAQTTWYFRKEFAEDCIVFLLKHDKLSEEEKSSLVKLPVLYLLIAFPYYSKESFVKVFRSALLLLEKNLRVPSHILAYINNYKKKHVETNRIVINALMGDSYNHMQLENDFARNPFIDVTLTSTLRNIIYNILNDQGNGQASRYKYLLNNLLHYENFLPENLFFREIISTLQKQVLEKNKLPLFNYFRVRILQKNPLNIILYIEMLIQQINCDPDERIVNHSVWGKGPQKCINYFQKLKILIDELEKKLVDGRPDYLEKAYAYLTNLIKISIDMGFFFDKINSDEIAALLSRFIKLGYKLKDLQLETKIHLPLDLFLPIFLKCRDINSSIMFLEPMAKYSEKFSFNKSMFGLILIYAHLMDRMNICFDRSQNQDWYSKTNDTQELINICTSPFLDKNNQIITHVDSIDLLIKEIQAAQEYLQPQLLLKRQEKIMLKIDYLTECMLLCDVLVHWTKAAGQPKNIEDNRLQFLKILRLKEILLKSVHDFLKPLHELEFVDTGNAQKLEKILIKQKRLIEDISLMRKKINTDIQQIRSFFSIYKNNLPSFFPFSIHTLSRYTQLNLQYDLQCGMKVHTLTYPKFRKMEALNLEPAPIVAIKWYCDTIASLYDTIKIYYEKLGRNDYAIEAERGCLFFCDYRNQEQFEFDTLVKTLRYVYNLLEDFFPDFQDNKPAQIEYETYKPLRL